MSDIEAVLVPGELRVLIHHSCFPEWEQPKTPFYRMTVNKLMSLQLLKYWNGANDSNGYMITQRGRVHVDALCARPLPEKKWVSP